MLRSLPLQAQLRLVRDAGLAPRGAAATLLAAAASTLATALATAPIDMARTRYMASLAAGGAPQYRSTWDVARRVAAREGPRALFRGLGPQLLGSGPYSVAQFAVWECLCTAAGVATL